MLALKQTSTRLGYALPLVTLALLAGLLAATASAAGPPNVVTNGDFSDGMNYWTDYSSPAVNTNGSCGSGVATMPEGGQAVQIIKITSLPAGDSWTLEADLSGNWTQVMAELRPNPDCSGSIPGGNLALYTSSSSMEHKSQTKVVAGVQCVELQLVGPVVGPVGPDSLSGGGSDCIDNVSLGGPSATVVSLSQLEARPGGAGTWTLAATAFLGVLAVIGVGWRWRRRATR